MMKPDKKIVGLFTNVLDLFDPVDMSGGAVLQIEDKPGPVIDVKSKNSKLMRKDALCELLASMITVVIFSALAWATKKGIEDLGIDDITSLSGTIFATFAAIFTQFVKQMPSEFTRLLPCTSGEWMATKGLQVAGFFLTSIPSVAATSTALVTGPGAGAVVGISLTAKMGLLTTALGMGAEQYSQCEQRASMFAATVWTTAGLAGAAGLTVVKYTGSKVLPGRYRALKTTIKDILTNWSTDELEELLKIKNLKKLGALRRSKKKTKKKKSTKKKKKKKKKKKRSSRTHRR